MGATFDSFLATYGAKYPPACECLAKNRDDLLTFGATNVSVSSGLSVHAPIGRRTRGLAVTANGQLASRSSNQQSTGRCTRRQMLGLTLRAAEAKFRAWNS